MVLYMTSEIIDIFRKTFYTYFIQFLDLFKDNFARPPAHNFGLLCNIDFPISLSFSESSQFFTLLISYCYVLGISRVRLGRL